jgi:hypothetical protein
MTAPDSAVLADMQATVDEAKAELNRATEALCARHTPGTQEAFRKAMATYVLAVTTYDDELRMRLAMVRR